MKSSLKTSNGEIPCRRRTAVLPLFALLVAAFARAADKPTVLRTPDRGIQPQAVVDAKGVLHLIYFKGKDSEGDLFYVRKESGQERFSAPVRRQQPARQRHRRRHHPRRPDRARQEWPRSCCLERLRRAMPRSPGKSSPMLYARLDDDGKAFEPQRNLITQTYQLDGGGTVAADNKGNVYIAWHSPSGSTRMPPRPPGEANRQVWLARFHG